MGKGETNKRLGVEVGGRGGEGRRGSFGVEATGPPVVNRTSTDAMVSGGALRLWDPFFHKKISLQRIELFLNKKGTLFLLFFFKFCSKNMYKKN